ncbi:MAG: hypothetical protein WC356_01990 [Candidatus Micrarchaeia archaeon]|jgi:hypothetical protein
MGYKTINGCLNLSTKQVVFQGEACDSGDYTGCYVSSGIHEGQISVTISEANCDDTYYACFNSGTGQFNLTIPDDCCIEYGTDCGYCGVPTNTPKYISITFSGISLCDCIIGSGSWSNYSLYNLWNFDINDTFILTQDGNCEWNKYIGTNTYGQFSNPDCSGDYYPATRSIIVSIVKSSNNTSIIIDASTRYTYIFSANSTWDCSGDGSCNNGITACAYTPNGSSVIGFGGSASWHNV